jgi:hypothetical protein
MFLNSNPPISFHCFIFILALIGSIDLGFRLNAGPFIYVSPHYVMLIHVVFLLWTTMLILCWMFTASFIPFSTHYSLRISVLFLVIVVECKAV